MSGRFTATGDPTKVPLLQCDVVMKGGITSGVVFPGALTALSQTYRFRGLGGASAGAIGAAFGAAAEHGRAGGAFHRLAALPSSLGDGALMRLFQADRTTRPMLRLMLAATSAKGSKPAAVVGAALRSFPLAGLIGIAPGVAAIVFGATQAGAARWILIALGVVTALVGWLLAVLWRSYRVFSGGVTANNFGICTGMRVGERMGPGFTEWLAEQLDDLAGVTGGGPLTFGQLWTGTDGSEAVAPADRVVDLRMVTTCLSESQPFELPSVRGRYYFDAAEWRTLFPQEVVDHLVAHERAGDATDDGRLDDHPPPLTRLPLPEHLPVIVAMRMSLSFPLLISAIPMWTIDRRRDALVKVWFNDGGLCNNFPVQLFDAALPTRPTFAINLGRFGDDADEREDEQENLRWATNNLAGITPRIVEIPHTGIGAAVGFASAAFNAARNWTDVSQLDQPGYRDRIVEVLQTKAQGGMNLDMQAPTIERLSGRGAAAAATMINQFTTPKYNHGQHTGWDNHRWVRYRATLAALPDWLVSFRCGLAVLDIDPGDPPSYKLRGAASTLADTIASDLDSLGETIAGESDTVDALQATPNPKTVLRRVPVL